MRKHLFLLLLACGIIKFGFSQTAVYVCSNTGAYGYCYGRTDAADCAYNYCVSYGGENPKLILSTNATGFGAIAVGKNSRGRQIVGASAGYSTLAAAKTRAKQECQKRGGLNVVIEYTFNDQ